MESEWNGSGRKDDMPTITYGGVTVSVLGLIIAIIGIIFAILMMAGVVPVTETTVGGLFLAAFVSRVV
jgi:hypothetical protein